MGYEFIKANAENNFYPVTENEVKEVEKELDLKFPKELVTFLEWLATALLKVLSLIST